MQIQRKSVNHSWESVLYVIDASFKRMVYLPLCQQNKTLKKVVVQTRPWMKVTQSLWAGPVNAFQKELETIHSVTFFNMATLLFCLDFRTSWPFSTSWPLSLCITSSYTAMVTAVHFLRKCLWFTMKYKII